MLGADVVELLESGCGLIIGLATPDGTPIACRGWGLTVHPGGTRVTVLADADDLAEIDARPGHIPATTIAVTGTAILTLRSAQVKGPLVEVVPVDDALAQRLATYCDAFFHDVAVVDAIPRFLMERLVPADVVACTVDVVELYDQTPGPGAGRPLPQGGALR